MGAYLLSSRRILGSGLISASVTNQGGLQALVAVPNADNVGGMTFDVDGEPPTAVINEQLEIVAEGDLKTATFKASADGGSNWKGRRADTAWEDGEGGTTPKTISTNGAYASRPVLIDTDGDGVMDRAVVAVDVGSGAINLFYTDTLDGTGSWISLASDITGSSDSVGTTAPALVWHKDILRCFYSATVGNLSVVKSTDRGVTWGAAASLGVGSDSGDLDAISHSSGRILVAFAKDSGGYSHVFVTASASGSSWATALQVTAAGSVDYEAPTLIEEADGKTICFFRRTTATAAIQARQCTGARPWIDAWAAYSETLWSGDTGDGKPSACIAPDGTIYVAFSDGSPLMLEFSKFKDGDGLYSAAATIYDPAAIARTPKLANIGGAIWCSFVDGTNNDILLLVTRYWGTYDTTNYPASWTGPEAQFLHDGLWVTPGGGDASNGDSYDIDSNYAYGADRMVMLTPSRPSRSTADNADWSAPFDLGENKVVNVDTIAVMANVRECKFQGDPTSTFDSEIGDPASTKTISFIEESIGVAGVTWATGKVTRSSGTWTAHKYIGKRARAGSSGQVVVIVDNNATSIFCDADMSAYTGDLEILSDRAWATQTANAYRYRRLVIGATQTAEDYYEIKALAAGLRYELPSTAPVHVDYIVPVEESLLRSGSLTRTVTGPLRRRFTIPLTRITVAQRDAIVGLISASAGRPLVLIPDSTNAFDFAIVQPAPSWSVRALRTEIELIEIV